MFGTRSEIFMCTLSSILDQDHETWNDLFLNDLILVEARSDVLRLFYLLYIMIWVFLKSGIAVKFWVNICRSIRKFFSTKQRIHASSILSSRVYKIKAWCSEMTDLSDQYCWFIVAAIILLSINEVFLDMNVNLNA